MILLVNWTRLSDVTGRTSENGVYADPVGGLFPTAPMLIILSIIHLQTKSRKFFDYSNVSFAKMHRDMWQVCPGFNVLNSNLGYRAARTLRDYDDGLVQDCSNSIALAMGLLQSYTKPSVYV